MRDTRVPTVESEVREFLRARPDRFAEPCIQHSKPLQEVRMKRILWGMALVLVASAFAQQQPPTNSPPYITPPTFPQGRAQQQMPPDTKAPPPQGLSASEVEQQIQAKIQ